MYLSDNVELGVMQRWYYFLCYFTSSFNKHKKHTPFSGRFWDDPANMCQLCPGPSRVMTFFVFPLVQMLFFVVCILKSRFSFLSKYWMIISTFFSCLHRLLYSRYPLSLQVVPTCLPVENHMYIKYYHMLRFKLPLLIIGPVPEFTRLSPQAMCSADDDKTPGYHLEWRKRSPVGVTPWLSFDDVFSVYLSVLSGIIPRCRLQKLFHMSVIRGRHLLIYLSVKTTLLSHSFSEIFRVCKMQPPDFCLSVRFPPLKQEFLCSPVSTCSLPPSLETATENWQYLNIACVFCPVMKTFLVWTLIQVDLCQVNPKVNPQSL